MTRPNPFTDQQIADQITRDGSYWRGDNGDAIIKYAFPSNLGVYGPGGEFGLSATQIIWVELTLVHLESLFGIDFVSVAPPANTTGNYPIDIIQFANDAGGGTYSQSWTYTSGGTAFNNVVFDSTWNSNQDANLDYGSYGYMTMLHEVLHSLGMEHPGEYNAGSGNGPITYWDNAEFQQDTHRHTVMSYFGSYEDGTGAIFFDTTTGNFVYPRTLMVYDILAMSNGSFAGEFPGYAENSTTRVADTTYGHNATAGIDQAYNFDAFGAPVVTIYDKGGIDTLDLSGDNVASEGYAIYNPDGSFSSYGVRVRTDTLIDLREGEYSSTHGMTYNIGIAFGTVIENAIGTMFNDTIHGNAANNVLDGGTAGNDELFGYEGNDRLLGLSGADKLYGGDNDDFLDGGTGVDWLLGGDGNDTIVYDVNDDWSGGNVQGGTGLDTLLFELVWVSVDLFTYGFEQSALHLIDTAVEIWTEVYHYYNLEEDLFESNFTNDDGTSTNVVYDVDGTQTWSEWYRTYDSGNNLIDEYYVYDNTPIMVQNDEQDVSKNSLTATTGNVLDNDDGEALIVSEVNGQPVANSGVTEIVGTYGTLTIDAAGNYSYTVDTSNSVVGSLKISGLLNESFSYKAGNGSGDQIASVKFKIHSLHDGINIVQGTSGQDDLRGTAGSDLLLAGDGRDTIRAGEGDDVLDVGGNNGSWQYMLGEGGNDTYVYSKENGKVFILGSAESDTTGNADKVQFTDLNFEDFTVSYFDYGPSSAHGNVIRLQWNDGTDFGELRIANEGQYIEQFEFADGLTIENFISGGDNGGTLLGSSENDWILGGAGRDTIKAGEGNDFLDVGESSGAWQYMLGEGGDDTYHYSKENGKVFILGTAESDTSGTADKVVFKDLNLDDFTIAFHDYGSGSAHGNVVRMIWNDGVNSGELRIANEGRHIERFEFANGVVLDNFILGGDSGGTLLGTSENDWILGGDGRDTVYGRDGDDILNVGESNGSWQYMLGENGNDTYMYSKDNGSVFILGTAENGSSGTSDKIIFSDLNLDDITVAYYDYGTGSAHGNVIRLMWNDGTRSGELRIANEGQYIEEFVFADGMSLSSLPASGALPTGSGEEVSTEGPDGRLFDFIEPTVLTKNEADVAFGDEILAGNPFEAGEEDLFFVEKDVNVTSIEDEISMDFVAAAIELQTADFVEMMHEPDEDALENTFSVGQATPGLGNDDDLLDPVGNTGVTFANEVVDTPMDISNFANSEFDFQEEFQII